MSPVHKPSLYEWFNAYQHRALWRDNAFMVGNLDLDVTAVVADWEARGLVPHFPAIVARAAALAGARHPRMNRAYLRTMWGDRVVTFEGVHVVMPVRHMHGDEPVLDAIVLRDADRRDALALRDEIRAAAAAGLEATRLTRLVATRPNTLWWRTVLRAVHFLAWRWPLVGEHGGAIGVSAPVAGNETTPPLFLAGPTPLSVLLALSGLQREGGRTRMNLGVMGNHLVADGRTLGLFLQTLSALLEGREGVEALR